MDGELKVRLTLDALFGRGVSRHLPRGVELERSRKNGRIRSVFHDGELLCTLRIDGGIALTVRFAQMLLKSRAFAGSCVEVGDDAAGFISEGRSVFCRHVTRCGKDVRASSDVAVVNGGRVIAVGRAVVPHELIMTLGRGVAVRVRNSLKGRDVAGDAQ